MKKSKNWGRQHEFHLLHFLPPGKSEIEFWFFVSVCFSFSSSSDGAPPISLFLPPSQLTPFPPLSFSLKKQSKTKKRSRPYVVFSLFHHIIQSADCTVHKWKPPLPYTSLKIRLFIMHFCFVFCFPFRLVREKDRNPADWIQQVCKRVFCCGRPPISCVRASCFFIVVVFFFFSNCPHLFETNPRLQRIAPMMIRFFIVCLLYFKFTVECQLIGCIIFHRVGIPVL